MDGVDLHDLDYSERSVLSALIAHVPQSIYLADSSIAENIALAFLARRLTLIA